MDLVDAEEIFSNGLLLIEFLNLLFNKYNKVA